MALTDAFPGVGGVADTVDLRKDLAGLVVRDSAGLARAGVFPRHANALVTARASMGVDVAAFEAALVRGGGPLFIANDGTVTVAIGAAPSSNSRYDIVYVKQNESGAPFSDANNLPVFGFVSGAAAASPSLSAALALVPVGALPLASVFVPSTATTTQSAGVVVSQLFAYTTVTGGELWFRTQAERDAFSAGVGHLGYRLDTGRRERYLAASTSVTPNRPAGWYPVERGPLLEATATGSIASNAIPALTFTETSDPLGEFTTSATTIILPALHGKWKFESFLQWTSNSSGGRIHNILVDGTNLAADSVAGDSKMSMFETFSSISKTVVLNGGNTIRLYVGSTSNVTLTATAKFTITYMGPA